MQQFKDSKDATWDLAINCDTVEAIKEACGINVLDLLNPESKLAQEVAEFPPLLGKLLFAALTDQAKVKEVDDREFRRRMNGDALDAATDALMEELVSFCRKHRRKVAAAVLAKNREVEEATAELALTRLDDPELKAQVMAAVEANLRTHMQEALDRLGHSAIASSTAVGAPPDSSASPAPDLTPGDNSAG